MAAPDEVGIGTPKARPVPIDNWDEYFQTIAEAVKLKSKDPRCQVGAVIVSPDHVVLATGFNGLPRGILDRGELLDDADEKFKIICHAEQNAIINASRVGTSVMGGTMYVTKFPCLMCLNSIVQAGIKSIHTDDKWYWDDDPFDKKDAAKGIDAHERKRRLIKESGLVVSAPFHVDYRRDKPAIYEVRVFDQPRAMALSAQAQPPARAGRPATKKDED